MYLEKKFIFFITILLIGICEFQKLNANEINFNKKNYWEINSIERSKDIRLLNIPLEYTNFHKVELIDERGRNYSIILCKTADEWEEEGDKLKRKAIKEKVIADIETGVAIFEASHGEVIGGAIAGGMAVHHIYEAVKTNEESKEAYKKADEKREKEEKKEN